MGFLVSVARILEIFQRIFSDKKECLDLLSIISDLAKFLELLKNLGPKKDIAGAMHKATELVDHGAALRFPGLEMQYINELYPLHDRASSHVSKRVYHGLTVGIEDWVKHGVDLLEWKSGKPTVAVVVHGCRESVKTTLANAVVAQLEFGS